MITIDIDIDLAYDIYEQMSHEDKKDMVHWLKEDGFDGVTDNDTYPQFLSEGTIQGQEFQESLQILSKNRHNLSVEEESIIKRIADKYKFL